MSKGTLEPEMKFVLAKRNGIELPYRDANEIRAAYTFNDLPSFLKIYYEGMNVLVTEQDFYDLAYAYYARVWLPPAAKAEYLAKLEAYAAV